MLNRIFQMLCSTQIDSSVILIYACTFLAMIRTSTSKYLKLNPIKHCNPKNIITSNNTIISVCYRGKQWVEYFLYQSVIIVTSIMSRHQRRHHLIGDCLNVQTPFVYTLIWFGMLLCCSPVNQVSTLSHIIEIYNTRL